MRLIPACVALLTLAACGGGGGGGETVVNTTPAPVVPVAMVTLDKAAYQVGDAMVATVPSGQLVSASLSIGSPAQTMDIPVLNGKSLFVPVLTQAQNGSTAKLVVKTTTGTFESAAFTVSLIPITTSSPGLVTQLYLDASIANLQAAIDEMISIANSTSNPQALELQTMQQNLVKLRAAVVAARAGTAAVVAKDLSGNDIKMDANQLRVLDQMIAALQKNTTVASPTKAGEETAKAATERPAAIATLNCAGLTDPSDKAWCANMQVQLASDYIVNYANLFSGVAGPAAGILGALAAAGVAGVAVPAVLLGGVAVGAVVVANLAGAGIQAASASGTGTASGTNIRDNVKNLIGAARDFAVGQAARLIPSGGSELVKELNGAVTAFVADKYFDAADKTIAANTNAVSNCVASADSGGTGSFARRYDFGTGKALVLSYDAFNIPDQFEVFDSTGLLASTGGVVSNKGSLRFTPKSSVVTVKVNAPSVNTSWNYSIGCAS